MLNDGIILKSGWWGEGHDISTVTVLDIEHWLNGGYTFEEEGRYSSQHIRKLQYQESVFYNNDDETIEGKDRSSLV